LSNVPYANLTGHQPDLLLLLSSALDFGTGALLILAPAVLIRSRFQVL
jgi:hypothetical protein